MASRILPFLESYHGANVVITGGASGLGLGLAKRLVAEGARIFILSRPPINREQIKTFIGSGDYSIIDCDIREIDDVAKAEAVVARAVDRVDLLINNAGYATYTLFKDMSPDEVWSLATANFVGHAAVTSVFLPLMRRAQRSHLVFMTSIAGEIPITPNSVYSASKRGMEGLAMVLRPELRADEIDVTTILPGRIVTPFFDHPSFEERTAGRETSVTTTIDEACNAIISRLRRRPRRVFVPTYWRLISYALRAEPLVLPRILEAMLYRRVKRITERKVSDPADSR